MRRTDILLTSLLLGVLGIWTVGRVAPEIERDVEARLRAALDHEGLAWAGVSADGRSVRISGVAPSEEARLDAQRIASGIRGVQQVVNAATLARLAPVGAAPLGSRGSAVHGGCEARLSELLDSRAIGFPDARYSLRPDAIAGLDELAAALARCPRTRIEISGHADASGPSEVNLRLSMDRALAVADYLIAAGVAPERIATLARGEGRPSADNDTPEGRARNRRIAFRVLGG